MFDFTTPAVETKPDVFTLEALYPWLQSFPPEREYCWFDGGLCLFGQYAEHIGSTYIEVCDKIGEAAGAEGEWNTERYNIETTRIAFSLPHTFGAAAIRCRAAIETVTP